MPLLAQKQTYILHQKNMKADPCSSLHVVLDLPHPRIQQQQSATCRVLVRASYGFVRLTETCFEVDPSCDLLAHILRQILTGSLKYRQMSSNVLALVHSFQISCYGTAGHDSFHSAGTRPQASRSSWADGRALGSFVSRRL